MNNSNKNIVLIGMMGCGKTTIGRILSQVLDMDFVDMDEYIERTAGSTITEMFKKGEEYFRSLESEAAFKLSKLNSTVISTGGGIVKKSTNVDLLRKNSIIFFIDRPIEQIAADIEVSSRPLLKDGPKKLIEIFNERYNIYIDSSDIIIHNDKNIQDTLEEIIQHYNSICKERT